jgi:hypothetical protein
VSDFVGDDTNKRSTARRDPVTRTDLNIDAPATELDGVGRAINDEAFDNSLMISMMIFFSFSLSSLKTLFLKGALRKNEKSELSREPHFARAATGFLHVDPSHLADAQQCNECRVNLVGW